MNRTDDELVALAAKAAGIDTRKPFAPLADDGDTFCLAVTLFMLVDVRKSAQITEVIGAARGHLFRHAAPHGDDPAAATRRAIVEVAAQIGSAP